MQNVVKKQKCLNLEPKMPYLVVFGLEFSKTVFIFEINPSNLSTCKILGKKQICLNLGTKMPHLGIFDQEIKKPLSYLKSAPSNLAKMSL